MRGTPASPSSHRYEQPPRNLRTCALTGRYGFDSGSICTGEDGFDAIVRFEHLVDAVLIHAWSLSRSTSQHPHFALLALQSRRQSRSDIMCLVLHQPNLPGTCQRQNAKVSLAQLPYVLCFAPSSRITTRFPALWRLYFDDASVIRDLALDILAA